MDQHQVAIQQFVDQHRGEPANQFGDLVTSLYSWEGEGFATSANVTFQGGGVVSKAQFGLP